MPATQLSQELIRRNEERILLENTSDNDHRVGPHDVDNDLAAKLGEIVDSYNRVFVSRQQIVQSRLVLHKIIDARPIFERPVHVRNQPRADESLLWA